MLHIFIEGPDDKRFFEKIYGTCFGDHKFIQYAGWTPAKINSFVHSINCMKNCEYIFLSDADGRTIEEKKNILTTRYSNLDSNRIFIVQFEIESWYYAGASMSACQKLNLKQFIFNTDGLQKEQFNAKLPKKANRKYIMSEILEMYELELAITRNASLAMFNACMREESA